MKTAYKVMGALGGCVAIWMLAAPGGWNGRVRPVRAGLFFAPAALLASGSSWSSGVVQAGALEPYGVCFQCPDPYNRPKCNAFCDSLDAGRGGGADAGLDAGGGEDAGLDAGGDADAGVDPGGDAGVVSDPDAGSPDAGLLPDGGHPPPPDAGLGGGDGGSTGDPDLRYVGGGCSCGGAAAALNIAFLMAFSLGLARRRPGDQSGPR